MEIKNTTNASKVPFNLDGWSLLKNSKAELVELHLSPGQHLDKHKNPFDVIFYVIEGDGILQAKEEIQMKKFDSIFISSDVERGWINKSDKLLKLLVFKIFN